MDEILKVPTKITLECQLYIIHSDIIAAQDGPCNQPFVGPWRLHTSLQ
jgi:hypothetical protein